MKKIFFAVLSVCIICSCSNTDKKNRGYEEKTEPQTVAEEEYTENQIFEPVATESSETITQTDETEEETESSENEQKLELSGRIILIDPGHGINSSNRKEPVAPGSSEKKNAFVSGTAGKNQTEEELNLNVGLKLKEALKEKGADVYMTRETHECDVSNVGRAQMGNDIGANLVIRLHADGSNSSSAKGISMLIPSTKYVTEYVYAESKVAGNLILKEVTEATGGKDRGVVERSDMTGFNWSEVPVILLEMGFMSNPEEDALLETEAYQQKIVDGIVNGTLKYFNDAA